MPLVPRIVRVCCMALAGAAVVCHGQVQAWVHRYVRPSGSQLLTAGPVLTANDVYLAGQVEDAGGDSEFALIRYGQASTVFSASTYNPGTNETDLPSALEVLPDGNLLMVGSSGNFLNTAMATAKFTPD